ncbi:MAG: hypothetical protein U0163_16910 [Gemmatimonadaceae bacterium]
MHLYAVESDGEVAVERIGEKRHREAFVEEVGRPTMAENTWTTSWLSHGQMVWIVYVSGSAKPFVFPLPV